MEEHRKYTLTIAGFDPSGGAGLLADIKTFEQCGVYGLGICTSVTYQNDIEFKNVDWLSLDSIFSQLDILLKRYLVSVVKIGLVKDLEMLQQIVGELKRRNDKIKIIWDPILKSSSGFSFHNKIDIEQLSKVLRQLFLITPNREEIIKMGEGDDADKIALQMSEYCSVLLKGGHTDDESRADDWLYVNGEAELISGERLIGRTKHGTGCVLSSAIASFLSLGYSLSESCNMAKGYVTAFIGSSDDLLGWHHTIVNSETHV